MIRFGDTDAMGHTNNSRFLTFCESSRIDYWEAATGEPFALVTHGAEESLILAEIRVTYRSPSYFGELLTVESRLGRLGRTSFTLEHRVTASESRAWARAARRHRGGRPGPLRLRHGAPAGHPRRADRAPGGLRGPAAPGLRRLRPRGPRLVRRRRRRRRRGCRPGAPDAAPAARGCPRSCRRAQSGRGDAAGASVVGPRSARDRAGGFRSDVRALRRTPTPRSGGRS